MPIVSDERYKQLMTQVGFPDSLSLLQALRQVENEVSIHYRDKLAAERRLVDDVYASMDGARLVCRDEQVYSLLSEACAAIDLARAGR